MDAPPRQQPDCLICFGPLRSRNPWRQPTHSPCECRPLIHRGCWEAWAAQAGPVCIICRSNKHYPAPPQQFHAPVNQNIIVFFGLHFDRCTVFLVSIVSIYLILSLFTAFQPPVTTYPPQPFPRRLEL
jgi:hypothetical protein